MEQRKMTMGFRMAVVLAIFTSCGSKTSTPATRDSQDQTVTILHTNDIHGNYMPFFTTTGSATSQTGDPGRDTLMAFNPDYSSVV